MRNPKNNFYRLFNLDKETREILKWYRQNYDKILNDVNKKIELPSEKDNK